MKVCLMYEVYCVDVMNMIKLCRLFVNCDWFSFSYIHSGAWPAISSWSREWWATLHTVL